MDSKVQFKCINHPTDTEPLSEILDIKIDLVDNNNQFGRVRGGSMTLRGLIAPFDLFKPGPFFNSDEVPLHSDTESDEEAGSENLTWALLTGPYQHFKPPRVSLNELAVKKAEDQRSNVYIRVGSIGMILKQGEEVYHHEDRILKRFKEETVVLL